MSSPLVPIVAQKPFYFDVVINSQLSKNRRIEAVHGDNLLVTFTILNTPNEESDLTGATISLLIGYAGSENSLVSLALAEGISVSGSQIIAALDTAALDQSGVYEYQLRLTKSGKSITLVRDYLDLDVLIE